MAARPSKRRKLSPYGPNGGASNDSTSNIEKAFFRSAANWELEEVYETRARRNNKKEKKRQRENVRLPIKAPGGGIHASVLEDEPLSAESDVDWADDGDEDAKLSATENAEDGALEEEANIPESEQIFEAKEELAKLAVAMNEDPEENLSAFKALAKIGQSRLGSVRKLALVTQLAVYKDVIPGYRIRPLPENPLKEKLSKEVRTLQAYEQALISGYQAYVKGLVELAKPNRSSTETTGQDLSSVAIACACTLVTKVPHFNFRGELLKILVGKLSRRKIDDDFVKCRQAIETLFFDDEEGQQSYEAVSLLCKMMKTKEYQVDESVLNLFLHLRLLSEFSGKASQDRVEHQNGATSNGMKSKQKKEFRTKRERKALKERKALETEMVQADALVSHEGRDRMQSETLKLVFATYFRILKLRLPHLMGAVLEGLAKYAHLINQDFFGDLLEALKDLVRHSDEDADADDVGDESEGKDEVVRDTSREALLCTVTAFALLAGQDAHNSRGNLHLDLSFFSQHLFQSLLSLSTAPDLELTSKSFHLADPDAGLPRRSNNRVNLQTTTVLLIRCLTATLLPPWNIRSVPPLRVSAFAKQLATAALHMPEKSCQAALVLLGDVVHTHGRKVVSLWNTEERKGDGAFMPLSTTAEGSNPLAATVWEGELLRRHFSPKIRDGLKLLEKSVGSG